MLFILLQNVKHGQEHFLKTFSFQWDYAFYSISRFARAAYFKNLFHLEKA